MSRRALRILLAEAALAALLPCVVAAQGLPAPDTIEWTLHKTADGAHPDGDEQTYVWLMNRARQDPAAEGEFLATIDDPLVRWRLTTFGVDLGRLRAEFATLPATPPAAFDARLYEAARAHSLDMIARDRQDHAGQKERVRAAGFRSLLYRGNAYAFSESALEGHAAFNVDWGGGGGTGMQGSRPHRQAIMSVDGSYTSVGVAVVRDLDRRNQVGPFVVTGNYAQADESYDHHYDRFLVGTVWADANGNGRYDADEGIEGVTVTLDRGRYYAVTAAGGGYAIPLPEPGPNRVHFAGAGVPPRTRIVTVGAVSVLADYVVAGSRESIAAPEPGAAALGPAVALTLAALSWRVGRRPRTAGQSARRSTRHEQPAPHRGR